MALRIAIATVVGLITMTHGLAQNTSAPASAPTTRPALIPWPAEIAPIAERYALSETSNIVSQHNDPEILAIAQRLANRIADATGRRLPVRELPNMPSRLPQGTIMVVRMPGQEALASEGYLLNTSAYGIMLAAAEPTGLARGTETLLQLLEHDHAGSWSLPGVRIRDLPRYRWRGMLLDCGRHFMSKDFVKRYIDLLAAHKMNVLHWHLTEDQGWRIEIKKFPRLTEVGAWRRIVRDSETPAYQAKIAATPTTGPASIEPPNVPRMLTADERAALDPNARYGGFYTQADIREIVEYARERYITIVPEIELPGHALAALAAYPEFSCTGGPFEVGTDWGVFDDVYCAGNDATFAFLEEVLTEVIALFPSEYIHIGGDECPKTRWKACPKCQARMKAEGLKDEHELQSYFIRRIEKFLASKDRRIIGWDEILEGGLAPNATVQSWRGMSGAIAAAKSGHDVISSPTSHCYLDYPQTALPGTPQFFHATPLEKTYSFEPTPDELNESQRRHVLGLEGNMWTERAPQPRVDWQVFPRLVAIAEVGWSAAPQRPLDDFQSRLRAHERRLDAMGVTYFIAPPTPGITALEFETPFELTFSAPAGRSIRVAIDSEDMASATAYTAPIRIERSTVVRAQAIAENGRLSEVVVLPLRKLVPLEAVTPSSRAPGLRQQTFRGHWLQLPPFHELTPVGTRIVEQPTPQTPDAADDYALLHEGFFEATVDGVYTMHLTSDDGSRLVIGDETVADNDGLHAPRTVSGKIALRKGLHPLRIEYFQGDGASVLKLEIEPPGGAKSAVSSTQLWHTP